jgi:hypothetical protein
MIFAGPHAIGVIQDRQTFLKPAIPAVVEKADGL